MPDERRIETTAMSSDAEPGTTGEIVVLRRPPIRQATIIRADRNDSFDSFVRHIGAWWPVRTISIGRERVRDVTLEPRLGGRLYETWDDDTTIEWGTVMAWNPPDRFLISWLNTPVPTEVEFRFTELGANLTRASVEHRGWEALSEEQLSEDCAAPDGYRSGAYSRGWELILQRFAAAVDEASAGSDEREPRS